MRLKQYLIESLNKTGRHAMTYQKLLHALDTSHVTQANDTYTFNLGTVVKDSTLNGLNVIIQSGDASDAKLGQKKDGTFVLVVTTKKLPANRKELDSLLSSDDLIASKFISSLGSYYSTYRDKDADVTKFKQEEAESLTDPEVIEGKYNELISAIDALVDEHGKASETLDDGGVNILKNVTNDMAKAKLKNSYFGSDENEFVKLMMKLPQASFIKLLDKQDSKKILSRLQSYREQMK